MLVYCLIVSILFYRPWMQIKNAGWKVSNLASLISWEDSGLLKWIRIGNVQLVYLPAAQVRKLFNSAEFFSIKMNLSKKQEIKLHWMYGKVGKLGINYCYIDKHYYKNVGLLLLATGLLILDRQQRMNNEKHCTWSLLSCYGFLEQGM